MPLRLGGTSSNGMGRIAVSGEESAGADTAAAQRESSTTARLCVRARRKSRREARNRWLRNSDSGFSTLLHRPTAASQAALSEASPVPHPCLASVVCAPQILCRLLACVRHGYRQWPGYSAPW